jgi:transcriptional regulator GlxA family with amidase domain
VARLCGFSSAAHLAHLFRRHLHTTPRQAAKSTNRPPKRRCS